MSDDFNWIDETKDNLTREISEKMLKSMGTITKNRGLSVNYYQIMNSMPRLIDRYGGTDYGRTLTDASYVRSVLADAVRKGPLADTDAERMFNSLVGAQPSGPISKSDLSTMRDALTKQNEILENLKKDALILHKVDRMSKCGKFTFVEKMGTTLRVNAPKGLKVGHEVLLHPKTYQIVEDLGFPPLEASPFSPGSIPSVTWDDIAGLENAKRDLVEAIEMPHRYKALYKHYKKRPVKGVLLSGDPGCGKTMLGKAAANSLAAIYGAESAKTGFLYIKGPEILNQYVGQTEQTIREIFIDAGRHHAVHGYPAVIFIDEADAILATRGSRSIGIGNTIVPAFLTEMDGLEDSHAVVILATNRPDVLDPAIIREGRIDRKVHVTRPDLPTAIRIATLNLQNYPIAKGFDVVDMATGLATEIFSEARTVGNDRMLREIVNGAMIAAAADLAVAQAMHRDIAANKLEKGFSGVSGEDIIEAVNRIQAQNHGLNHQFE